jgi:hypothetical protein
MILNWVATVTKAGFLIRLRIPEKQIHHINHLMTKYCHCMKSIVSGGIGARGRKILSYYDHSK